MSIWQWIKRTYTSVSSQVYSDAIVIFAISTFARSELTSQWLVPIFCQRIHVVNFSSRIGQCSKPLVCYVLSSARFDVVQFRFALELLAVVLFAQLKTKKKQ
jgi:hypothetical protein